MNKAELRALVSDYIKRTDFSASTFDFWVNATSRRIGRALRGQVNLVSVVLTPLANPVALPVDMRQIRSVERLGDAGNSSYRLVAVEAGLDRFVKNNYGPLVYRAEGTSIEIRPFQSVELTIWYWGEPAPLVADGDTNAVLTDEPELYLYGCLSEAAIWGQDPESAVGYIQVFDAEVGALNVQGQVLAGDTPTMMGV